MANNCLVTKLKSVVDNDNLKKFECLRFTKIAQDSFNQNKRVRIFSTVAGKAITVFGNFADSLGTSIGTQMNIAGNDDTNIYCTTGETIFDIENKYNITSILCEGEFYNLEPDELKYCSSLTTLSAIFSEGELSNFSNLTNLTRLDISGVNLKGDVSSLSALTNLSRLTFSNYGSCTFISGLIGSLGTLTSLTRLQIVGTNIEGSIEAFVTAQRNNGRTTGSILFDGNGKVTYLNETKNTVTSTKTLSWTASEITYNDETWTA